MQRKLDARVILIVFLFSYLPLRLFSQPADFLISEFKNGWKINESAIVYKGDDLYFLIDGGADLFLEFGFKEVAAVDYSKENSKLHVEIYEMESAERAWGIFSIRRPYYFDKQQDKRNIAIGNGYIMATGSNYYFVISAQSKEVDPAEIYDLTMKISSEIRKKNDVANGNLTDFDPGEHDCIFFGRAGFAAVYSLGASNFQGFKRGLAKRKSKEEFVIRLEYTGINDAINDLEKFISASANTNRYKILEKNGEKLLITDRDKVKILIQRDSTSLNFQFSPVEN